MEMMLRRLVQFDLADFARVAEAGVVVGEDGDAGADCHFIERPAAPLWKNDGGGGADGGKVRGIGMAPRAVDVAVAFEKGMKGEDHQ